MRSCRKKHTLGTPSEKEEILSPMKELRTRSGEASKAQDATEEEAKGVDRDNPPGEARAPSASERAAFLNATHRVEGHCVKDDIGVQSEEATRKESEEEAKKVDPDNPSRQAAAIPRRDLEARVEGASLQEASEVRGELIGSDGSGVQVQQSSPGGDDEVLQSPATSTTKQEEKERGGTPMKSVSPAGAVEATTKVITSSEEYKRLGGQSDSSTGSCAEASEKSADNQVIDILTKLAADLKADADKRAAEADKRAAEVLNKIYADADKRAAEFEARLAEIYADADRRDAEMYADLKADADRRAAEFDERYFKIFASMQTKLEDHKTTTDERIVKIESTLDVTTKNINEVKINVDDEVKINVEIRHSQETTIKIIQDLEDNVKVEHAQERREVQADDTFRGSLPKDPDIIGKKLRGKSRSSSNNRARNQKWRSAGSHNLHRSGRTSISRMSLDQKPQKGRQRRVHAIKDGQVSALIIDLMPEYKFGDKPP